MNSHNRPIVWTVFILSLSLMFNLSAQESRNVISGSTNDQVSELRLELTNAWNGVLKIVNQPVQAYARTANMRVSVYSPGWFHEGASRPDFDNVDIRQSQDLNYAKNQYVTSDLNPGVVFRGQDLEFNSMTKYFYTNRALPKHRLSEAEMIEINRLYRIIGRCEREIRRLTTPVEQMDSSATSETDSETESGNNGLVGRIQSIPREKRMLYGGVGIGVLVLLVIVLKLLREKR